MTPLGYRIGHNYHRQEQRKEVFLKDHQVGSLCNEISISLRLVHDFASFEVVDVYINDERISFNILVLKENSHIYMQTTK